MGGKFLEVIVNEEIFKKVRSGVRLAGGYCGLAPFSGHLTDLAYAPNQHHADESGGGINATIEQRRSPSWHEDLVELIGEGIASGQQDGPQGNAWIPIEVFPALDACKDQQAKDAILRQVRGLPKVMVKPGESGRSNVNVKDVEDGGKNQAGKSSPERSGGEVKDESRPAARKDHAENAARLGNALSLPSDVIQVGNWELP